MRVNIISNIDNGAGLEREFTLLRAELTRRGHDVQGIHYQRPQMRRADLNIFLEVIEFTPQNRPDVHVPFERLRALAPRQFLVPDPEWFYPHWPLDCWDRVLCKTHDATRIFRGLVGDRCEYLGWQARDVYDPSVPRQRAFLHVAGKSRAKNTPAVLDGAKRAGVRVTVIAQGHQPRVTDAELAQLQNAHTFCLLPSAYEGYGHSLHEAYACGQVVLTTDAAPMNETGPAILIPPHAQKRQRYGLMHEVTGKAVCEAIRHALALSDAEVARMSEEGRAAVAFQRVQFQANLDRVLERAA